MKVKLNKHNKLIEIEDLFSERYISDQGFFLYQVRLRLINLPKCTISHKSIYFTGTGNSGHFIYYCLQSGGKAIFKNVREFG